MTQQPQEIERVTLSFVKPETKVIRFNKQSIEVVPYISNLQQEILIERYLEHYFTTSEDEKRVRGLEYDYLYAEEMLKIGILFFCTNIETNDKEVIGDTFDKNLFNATSLWADIVECIENYHAFRDLLWQCVDDKKEELKLKQSLGYVIDKAVIKITDVLAEFNKMNPEQLTKLKDESFQLLKSIEESPASNLFREGQGKPSVSVDKVEVVAKAKKGKKTDYVQ